MHLDLTDLRLFLNVHEAGTITGGAAATCMTLASASERIRGIEEALGVPLLLRNSRGIQVTPAGLTLARHARIVLQQMDHLRGELQAFSIGVKGHVRLLCNTSALSEHLPDVLAGFLAEHPGISVDLQERPSSEIVDAVRGDLCDIGLAADSANLENLESFFFRADPLVLVVPRAGALAKRRKASLLDVVDLPFVGLAEGSALQAHISHHARRLGKRLRYRIRLRSLEAVCRAVGQGIGIGIVPQAVADRCGRAAQVRRITLTDAWADRNLVLCTRRLDELPAHTRQLVQHLLVSRGEPPLSRASPPDQMKAQEDQAAEEALPESSL
jgi:DNA-binding transcriptional LysR family regulator